MSFLDHISLFRPNKMRDDNAGFVAGAIEPITSEQPKKNPDDILFDKRFGKIEQIYLDGAYVDVIDVKPDKIKNKTPILLAPGFSANPKEYREAIKKLYFAGRRVVSVTHLSYGGSTILNAREKYLVGKCPPEEIRKARTLLAVLDAKMIEHADVVAHSAGAINAAIAALIAPNKIRNIVFCSPAGVILKNEKMGMVKAVGRSLATADSMLSSVRSMAQSMKNPVRTWTEGMGLTEADIHTVIKKLHDNGVGMIVVGGSRDNLFHPDNMVKFLSGKAQEDNPVIDGFLLIDNDHGHLDKYIDLIEPYFTLLEQKKRNSVTIKSPRSVVS